MLVLGAGYVANAFLSGTSEGGFSIHISKNETYDELRGELKNNICHFWAFDLYARYLKLSSRFKGGYYKFLPGENVRTIAKRIAIGDQNQIALLITHKRQSQHMAEQIAEQIEADYEDVLRALRDGKNCSGMYAPCDSLFAFILPDTYFVFWNTEPNKLIKNLLKESERFFTPERLAKARECSLSTKEVIILSSIVQEETSRQDDMLKIAAVYLNRLKKKHKLQACPTVRYAIQDFSMRRILNRHLRYRSPYNTYLNNGLPPTPICTPTKQAIDAVLNHDRNGYMFFCADALNPGHTIFSKTLAEHNQASKRFRKKLDDLKIYK